MPRHWAALKLVGEIRGEKKILPIFFPKVVELLLGQPSGRLSISLMNRYMLM